MKCVFLYDIIKYYQIFILFFFFFFSIGFRCPTSYERAQNTRLHRQLTRAVLHIASLAAHTTLNTYNLWKLTLRGHLNTDVQAGLELGTFRSRELCLNRQATAPRKKKNQQKKNKYIYLYPQSLTKIMRLTTNFTGKQHFLCIYTEKMVNFRPQSCKAASRQKPLRGLGTRLPSS